MNSSSFYPFYGEGGSLIMVAAVLALLSGCASQPSGPVQHQSGELQQRVEQVVRQAAPEGQFTLQAMPATIVTGQALNLQVDSDSAGYLYVYQVATDGRTMNLVFPNAVDGANFINRGRTQLPRPAWQLKARGPVGVGYMLAVLTREPQSALEVHALAEKGQVNPPAPYRASLAVLREVAQ